MKLHKNYSHYGKYLLLTDVSKILPTLLCLFHCSFLFWNTLFGDYSENILIIVQFSLYSSYCFILQIHINSFLTFFPDIWLIYFSEIQCFYIINWLDLILISRFFSSQTSFSISSRKSSGPKNFSTFLKYNIVTASP